MKVIAGGQTIELGEVQTDPTVSIIDYSRRVTDDFGVTTVVPRGFAHRMSVRLALPFDQADTLQRQLADLRATPAMWIADERFGSLSFEGFYKEFAIDMNVPPMSFCTLTVEGLAVTDAGTDPGGDPAADGKDSTLRLVMPATITGAVLASSSVPEDDYRDRMQMFANRALARGASYVALGLDPWFPDLGPTRQAQVTNRQPWDVLDRALERAVVSYQGGANDGKVGRAANLYRLFKFSPPVYREEGLTIGVHLTLEGNEIAGEEEGRLLEAKYRGLAGVTGAVRAPYIEQEPILLIGTLAGVSVNAPFIHISNTAVTSATVGQTLSLFGGSWAGGVVSSLPNQWLRDGIPIPGATGGTYVLTSADAGKTITATSSRVNPAGTGTATTPLGVTVS